MRVALGLVSLLVVVAIILLLFNFYTAPMLKETKTTRQQAQQISGRDEDNAPVTHAIMLDAQDRNGRMEAAVVTDLMPGSKLETHYGLQKGDVILELGQVTVRGNITSADEAKDFLLHAYQRNEPLVVMRGFDRITLPQEAPARNAAANAPEAAPAPSAEATAPSEAEKQANQQRPAQKKPGGLEGQLDLIRNAGQPQQQE